ncbi:diguanylate cyclase, partial [Vibrio xuii]
LIEFAERIEQDIPESCLFAKLATQEESEFADNRRLLDQNNSLLGEEVVNSNLIWGNTVKSGSSSGGSPSAVDDLRLGVFKQRVISAFS